MRLPVGVAGVDRGSLGSAEQPRFFGGSLIKIGAAVWKMNKKWVGGLHVGFVTKCRFINADL